MAEQDEPQEDPVDAQLPGEKAKRESEGSEGSEGDGNDADEGK